MELNDLIARAKEIRERYKKFETRETGRAWTRAEVAQGFVVDVGELMELVMAKEGIRTRAGDLDEQLAHELSDCLWCVLVLADEYGIDIEKAFLKTMDDLVQRTE